MDPNPIKHPAALLRHVRDAIEPVIEEAGFLFESRNNPRNRLGEDLWIDWARGDELVSLRWDRRNVILSLEIMDKAGKVQTMASVCTSGVRSTNDLKARIDQFVDDVKEAKALNSTLP